MGKFRNVIFLTYFSLITNTALAFSLRCYGPSNTDRYGVDISFSKNIIEKMVLEYYPTPITEPETRILKDNNFLKIEDPWQIVFSGRSKTDQVECVVTLSTINQLGDQYSGSLTVFEEASSVIQPILCDLVD